jgi:Restriction endonuclease
MKQEKGNCLERAVKLIEEAILKNHSGLNPDKFIVEDKKIVIAEDVRHEVDLYVEVSVAQGYKSIFIFECKNWQDNVGKNEIIIFSEKIRVTCAQKGFFIAQGFTKYAVAQAAKDERIELLLVSDFPLDIYPFGRMLVTGRSVFNGAANFILRSAFGKQNPSIKNIDISTSNTVFNGSEIDFCKFLDEESDKAFNEALKQIDTASLDAGAYPIQIQRKITFPENRLLLNGDDVAEIHLDVLVSILIHKPRVVYYFSIESRGRYVELEPYDYGSGHGALTIALAAPLGDDISTEAK